MTYTTQRGIEVSSLANSPISPAKLQMYLPNFDPAVDPQVGEWVMVSPARAAALLDPLISMWELTQQRFCTTDRTDYGRHDTTRLVSRTGFSPCAVDCVDAVSATSRPGPSDLPSPPPPGGLRREWGVTSLSHRFSERAAGIPPRLLLSNFTTNGENITLASLSLSKSVLYRRKRGRLSRRFQGSARRRTCGDASRENCTASGMRTGDGVALTDAAAVQSNEEAMEEGEREDMQQDESDCADDEDLPDLPVSFPHPLYLHVRLGLLTLTPPAVFGGSDVLEVVALRRREEKKADPLFPAAASQLLATELRTAVVATEIITVIFPTESARAITADTSPLEKSLSSLGYPPPHPITDRQSSLENEEQWQSDAHRCPGLVGAASIQGQHGFLFDFANECDHGGGSAPANTAVVKNEWLWAFGDEGEEDSDYPLDAPVDSTFPCDD